MRKITLFILGFMTLVSLSAQEKLEKKVIANGATKAGNGTVKLNGTLGQTFIGLTQNVQIKARIGFWETVLEGMSTAVVEVDFDARPSGYFLGQNYPNPADQTTYIDLEIAERKEVSIRIYSNMGEYLGEIHRDRMAPGKYKLSSDISHLPKGNYLYSLFVEGKIIASRKMSVMHH